MTSLLHLAAGADALLAAITTASASLGEIVTAGALLRLVNQLADLIRLAYRAGAIAGHFAWPVIHGLTAAAKWAWANVDWAEVGLIIRAGLIALVGLTWAGAVTGHRLLVLGSAALGLWSAALLLGGGGGANPAAPAVAAPVVAKAKPKPKRRRHGRAGQSSGPRCFSRSSSVISNSACSAIGS